MVGEEGRASSTLVQSFGFAFRGLAEAWRLERNFRIQSVYTLVVVGLLVWLRPAGAASLLVLFSMLCLLAAELMNSALERTVDLASAGFHPLARSAKDIAAASVLVIAIASAVVNLAVFASLIPTSSSCAFGGMLLGVVGIRFAPRGALR